jgi:tetratricopeptide (TPR) repeat protein
MECRIILMKNPTLRYNRSEERNILSISRQSVSTFMTAAVLGALLATTGFPAQKTSSAIVHPSELANEGKSALERGDSQAAIRAYAALIQLDPHSARNFEGLGIAYYTAGRPLDAAQSFSKALKLEPALAHTSVFPHFFGASLAESGRCREALPYLRKDPSEIQEPVLKRAVEMDGIRCAMELDEEQNALNFLSMLNRDFPKDPQALYLTVHVYSDLSTRAAQRLLTTDPGSYQVHELNAESLEMQNKWKEAEEEYRRVLAMKPDLPGIHYRIGRLILSEPRTPATLENARREFEAELKIDPRNAGAEYVLGELGLQQRRWDEAEYHFRRATQLDPNFGEAYLELGRALVTSGHAAQAVAPLERAVKLEPGNPEGHYLLATAYRRAGRAQDANRELTAYRQAQTTASQSMQGIRAGILGRKSPAQLSQPSQP